MGQCYIKLEEQLKEYLSVPELSLFVNGHTCNVEAIKRIADEYNLKVIFDAAHAFGIRFKGIGNYGNAAVFSFHATKIYNSIEGGAVAFSDHMIYEKLYNLKNFGIRDEETFADIGVNVKMNEFAAIMGQCNLRHVEETF